MKLVSTILSILILCLTIAPCDDSKCAGIDEVNSHFHVQDNREDHSHTDNCSPFCVCNCCQTSVLLITNLHKIKTPVKETNFISEIEKFNSISLFDLWRPPQS